MQMSLAMQAFTILCMYKKTYVCNYCLAQMHVSVAFHLFN